MQIPIASGLEFRVKTVHYLACLLGFGFLVNQATAQQIPQNASKNTYGSGWTCNRGFQKSGSDCLKIKLPANASLNYTGNGWNCNRGYFKSGEQCSPVEVPANGSLNYAGNGWICNKGYAKDGGECKQITLPENAVLDITGNNWACKPDFVKQGQVCRQMTTTEKAVQDERARRVQAALEARRAQIAAGQHCDTEYRSGAEVCLSITNREFDCQKAIFGDYYQSCEVQISYQLQTNYRGNSSVEAYFECSADISYSGKNIFGGSDSSSERKRISLFANDTSRGTVNLNFSFAIFAEATRAQVVSTSCRIRDLNLY